MNLFDEAYRLADGYFGGQPERSLVGHVANVDAGRPVLDIGCGQGRNALFLAREGITVDALDPSSVAIDQVSREAGEHRLPIRTIRGTFQDISATDGTYGAILAFGLIPLLDRAGIEGLIGLVTQALSPGGLLFVTAFGTWDPAYARIASEWQEVSTRSFRGPNGDLRTYVEPGELRQLFSDFDAIHCWEGLGPEHRHGSGQVERHGMAEAVFRR